MGISTSTGTLIAGQSRTFNLSPASAVTLTLSPNVRVTITESPATVTATGLGGNATRVHEPRLPGVVTYGPYPMGGSVLVEVESNSGSSVSWVRSDSIVAESADGAQSVVDGGGNTVSVGGGLSLSATDDVPSATANKTTIQAALAAGGLVQILTPGTYYVDAQQPLVIPSKTKLVLGNGVVLTARAGRICPVLKNKYAGNLIAATQLVRASNVVTVSEAGHTKTNGDQVFVSLGSTASFRGLVTVQGVVAGVSWQYASTGTDGNAGAVTSFYSLIPVRQTLAGAAFVATAFYVTVTDAGHDKRPGMNVWIGKDGGDNFAPGIVQVTKVTADTWTYKTAAASGTASGTFALSYDYDIEIDGGVIDGNRLGQGAPVLGSANQLCTTWFGCVTGLQINSALGGSSIRGMTAFNCASVQLDKQWRPFDCLVGCQFEGGGVDILVDQAILGNSQFYTTTAQKTDDFVAFTGTELNGGGGNYDDVCSPYGLTFYSGVEVRRINPVNSLNGIKITSKGSACPFIGTFKIGAVYGRNLDNAPLFGTKSAINIQDDGSGLIGQVIETIDIDGPLEWATASGLTVSATALIVNCTGTIGAINVSNLVGESNMLNSVFIGSAACTIKVLDFDKCSFIPLGASTPNMNLQAGTIQRLSFRNSRVQLGTSKPLLYGNGTVINALVFDGIQLTSETSNSGDLYQHHVAASAPRSISFKGITTPVGAVACAALLVLEDVAFSSDIYLEDCDFTSGSGMRTSGVAATGTVNVYLGAKVRWTAIGGNNFLQVGGCTWQVWGGLNNRNSLPPTKMFLTGFGTPVFKSIGFTQVLTPGATPAVDCGLGNNMTLAIGANATATLGAPTNVPPAGTVVTMTFTQDATGGRNMAFNAAYIFPTAWSNAGNTANTISEATFVSNGTKLIAQGANAWHA